MLLFSWVKKAEMYQNGYTVGLNSQENVNTGIIIMLSRSDIVSSGNTDSGVVQPGYSTSASRYCYSASDSMQAACMELLSLVGNC